MKCLDSFDHMCKRIVSPVKFRLNERQIIQREIKGKSINYKNFTLKNDRGYLLSGLIFINNLQQLPTILYLHGNGGSKLQILPLLRLNSTKYNYVSFDFSGCGKSEGEYITYGKNEVKDIQCIVQYLQNVYKIQELSIWGRSMGAVAAILFAKASRSVIRSMVLDSPFPILEKVLKNVASKQSIPSFFFYIAFFFIRNKVQGMVDTNIFDEKYVEAIGSFSHIPILFGYSEKDEIVLSEDVMELYNNYPGQKMKFLFNSSHSDERPAEFILEALRVIEQKAKNKQFLSNYKYLKQINQTPRTHHSNKSN